MDMVRVDKILAHPSFLENLQKNREAETDRRFCRHDMTHFLDVARIGTLINLEEGQEIPKDLIYGAALLHDLGRHEQYREGIPHEQAGAAKAPSILSDCGGDSRHTAASGSGRGCGAGTYRHSVPCGQGQQALLLLSGPKGLQLERGKEESTYSILERYSFENRKQRISDKGTYLCLGDPECDAGFFFRRGKMEPQGQSP